ncbi:MAG: RNA polymerase sigma factor [Phycisphaerae bacterium]
MNDPAEARLLADAVRGDARAFETVYVRYHQRVRLVAWRICRRGDWVDDLTNEAWRRAFEARGNFDPTRNFLVWISGILRNVAREQRRQRPGGHAPGGDEPALDGFDPERLAAEAELLAALRDCTQRLPADERELVRLRFFEGATLREIAERMGIPEATVRESRLPAVCDRLRECLRAKGLEDFSWISAQDGAGTQLIMRSEDSA